VRVFKGLALDNCANFGKGRMKYEVGQKMTAESADEFKTGLHWSEYVMVCVGYYNLGAGHIYLAEAGGDTNEDSDTNGASTELTLLHEMDHRDIVIEALIYMYEHPLFKGWMHHSNNCIVAGNKAECRKDGIAIARGKKPMCRGGEGAVLGFYNDKDEEIRFAVVGKNGVKPGKWYRLNEGIISEVGEHEVCGTAEGEAGKA